MRRKITVGNRVIVAAVCEICPTHPAIWPESALLSHYQRHELVQAQAKVFNKVTGEKVCTVCKKTITGGDHASRAENQE